MAMYGGASETPRMDAKSDHTKVSAKKHGKTMVIVNCPAAFFSVHWPSGLGCWI